MEDLYFKYHQPNKNWEKSIIQSFIQTGHWTWNSICGTFRKCRKQINHLSMCIGFDTFKTMSKYINNLHLSFTCGEMFINMMALFLTIFYCSVNLWSAFIPNIINPIKNKEKSIIQSFIWTNTQRETLKMALLENIESISIIYSYVQPLTHSIPWVTTLINFIIHSQIEKCLLSTAV